VLGICELDDASVKSAGALVAAKARYGLTEAPSDLPAARLPLTTRTHLVGCTGGGIARASGGSHWTSDATSSISVPRMRRDAR
jgi:hypothetical protein